MNLETQYNNRALVPDHPAVMQGWRETAEAARAAHPPLEIAYGNSAREVMDLFEAAPGAPIAVFLHGGYWQALDKSWFSGLAPALLAHGVSLAIPSYDLCPTVRLGTILRMAACMLSEGRASAAVAISGIFDLAPLIPTSLNTALDLDDREAAALSPIHWPIPNGSTPGGTVLDCYVGAEESPEFLRQSRMMTDHWAASGVETRYEALLGLNHFTVLDPLYDMQSAMVTRITRLAQSSA